MYKEIIMNSTVRLNITLPQEIAIKLKARKNYSRYIAESLEARFIDEEREKMKHELVEGYKARAKDNKHTNQEWDHLVSEGIGE